MLKKGFRLRKKEDFDRVFRSGKALFFNEIGCRHLTTHSHLRLGFSLSRKHLPLAVERNRLRRVLSEAFFQLKDEWPEHGDIVLFTLKKPKKFDIESSRTFVQDIFEHIRKTNNKH